MTQISAFSPIDQALQPQTDRFNQMSSEEFIKIIFTELSHQDPFQPNDSSALLEQLNSIRSIESDIQLMDRLDSLVLENQIAGASAMIGKVVGGINTQHERVAGYVTAVVREGDQVMLELDAGWMVPIESVETVIDESLFTDEPDDAPPDDSPPDDPPDTPA